MFDEERGRFFGIVVCYANLVNRGVARRVICGVTGLNFYPRVVQGCGLLQIVFNYCIDKGVPVFFIWGIGKVDATGYMGTLLSVASCGRLLLVV